MILKGTCKKCGTTIRLDIGDAKDAEEAHAKAREDLERWESFSCPGHHVELCGPYPNYWDTDNWELEEGHAQTEEEFLTELKSKTAEVIDSTEMHKRGVITSFCFGLPVTNDGINWDFTESPQGKRYYYHY